MDIRDITKEQFETLILLRSLEAFITDEYEDLSNLSEVVCNFADNQDTEEFNRLAKDICKLTETGYVISDMTEISDEDLEFHMMPEVEGITPKGKSALEALEQKVKGDIAAGKKIVLFENFTLFNFDVSLLGGVDFNLIKEVGGLFKSIGKRLMK